MTACAGTAARVTGFAALFRRALEGGDMVALRSALIDRASREPEDASVLWELSLVLQFTGDRDVAMSVQAQALRMQGHYHVPAPHAPVGLRLLAVMGPGDLMANTPVECLLEGSDVSLDMIYVTPGRWLPSRLPEHDVLMVCVGENDANRPLLDRLSQELAGWPRPIVNRPSRVLGVSRDGVCASLAGAPGVVMPETVRVDRAVVASIASGATPLERVVASAAWPIIIRPAGSHAGNGLQKIDRAADLDAYLADQPAPEFSLAPFVDYRQADGLFRKYRVALIDGRPFLCHLGISSHWMIHYANAGMAESASKRDEEARAMAAFDDDFAARHADAFRAIHARVGLDYLGIDCGETADGRLLVFEADNGMIVHAMDPVDLYPYKQPQMRKVFTAFRAMLARRARQRYLTVQPYGTVAGVAIGVPASADVNAADT